MCLRSRKDRSSPYPKPPLQPKASSRKSTSRAGSMQLTQSALDELERTTSHQQAAESRYAQGLIEAEREHMARVEAFQNISPDEPLELSTIDAEAVMRRAQLEQTFSADDLPVVDVCSSFDSPFERHVLLGRANDPTPWLARVQMNASGIGVGDMNTVKNRRNSAAALVSSTEAFKRRHGLAGSLSAVKDGRSSMRSMRSKSY